MSATPLVSTVPDASRAIYQNARVLIVDDQLPNVRLLERHLNQVNCTQFKSTTDSRLALDLFRQFAPDIVLLDLMMPYLSGFDVMAQLQQVIAPDDYLPILVLTADIDPGNKRRALEAGARDFLTKPFDSTEVMLRMRNLLETRMLHRRLQGQKEMLEARVLERTHELEESQFEVINRLALAAEYRDDDTGQHTQRVGLSAALLGRRLGMAEAQVELLRRAAQLHDVGKIGISDAILLKPGKLEPHEFDAMKEHTSIGAKLLAGGHSELVKTAETIALSHHEKWNGRGYPHGLRGEEIPLAGRIVALADVFDALTYERPYKRAWPVEEAVREIASQAGEQFDPQVAAAFLELRAEGSWPCFQEVDAPILGRVRTEAPLEAEVEAPALAAS